VTGARRILVFEQDEAFLRAVERLMSGAGMRVLLVRDPAQLTAQVAAFQPDLILLDRAAPGTAASEAIALLRDTRVPLVFVLANLGERELIRALQAHAVEVLQRPFGGEHVQQLVQLMDELARRPTSENITWEDQVARNFVDLAHRHKLKGTLMVNRGTPFEGRMVLKDGALARAEYGPLTGTDAVREILQMEDGQYELDASLNLPHPKIAHSATELEPGRTLTLGAGDTADVRPRLLAVDDEPHLLALISRFLASAGFDVTTAVDGVDAVDKARKSPFDLIVADLSMPRMDGWEMLKTLKADHRTSELPVVFLSAHDDYREALRAARAGAHDYLSKTGHSQQVVSAALKTITPRLETMFHLLVNEPVEVRTPAVGLQWFLRALQRLGSTGTLSLEDSWGRYQVAVSGGQPVSAQAAVQQRKVLGMPAFVRMMVAGAAQGRFVFGPVQENGPGALGVSMDELIGRACESLNAAEAKATEQKLASATELDLDPELYELFCRIAPARKVAFARAVCERKMPMAEVAGSLNIGPEQAEDWFRELLRREVLMPPAMGMGARRPDRPWTPNELHPEIVKRTDRKRAIVDHVRTQLGEDPWVPIASELATVLGLTPGKELTFPDLVKLAAERGFKWQDVHLVVERLTASGALQRRFMLARADVLSEVPATEVALRLAGALGDDQARQEWERWADGVRVIWRTSMPSET